jgi:hypothetical protein
MGDISGKRAGHTSTVKSLLNEYRVNVTFCVVYSGFFNRFIYF